MRRSIWQRVVPLGPWNRFVDFYFRNRIEQVIVDDSGPWRHPWFTRVQWDPFEEHWYATIKPSACVSETSDGDPTVAVEARFAPAETRERLGISETAADESVDAYLSELPEIVLDPARFRAIGTDAVASTESEAVPKYFAERGVLGPQVLEVGGSQVVVRTSGVLAERASARLLRACEIVLTHERARTEVLAQVATTDIDAIDVDYLRDAYGVRPDAFLSIESEYRPSVVPESLEILLGDAVDEGRDSIHLSTVYFLSPEGEPPGSTPDGRWTAHVDHRVSWPLQYVTRFEIVEPEPTRITVPAPQFAQGELGRIGERFAAAINENLQELENGLSEVQNEGRFGML